MQKSIIYMASKEGDIMIEATQLQIPLESWVLLAIVVVAIGVLLSKVLECSIRFVIAVCIVVALIGIGFYWLPSVIDNILNGGTTVEEVVDGTVNDFGNSGIAEAIGAAWNDMVEAIKGIFAG